MGQTFTKIKYATEGPWGSTDWEYLYLYWNRTCDGYTLYDNDMMPIAHFDDWGMDKDDFTSRLIELLTYMPDDTGEHPNNVEYCTGEEIEKLKENMWK